MTKTEMGVCQFHVARCRIKRSRFFLNQSMQTGLLYMVKILSSTTLEVPCVRRKKMTGALLTKRYKFNRSYLPDVSN